MSIEVTAKEAAEALQHILNKGLVPMLTGSPGVGKSDIVRKLAEKAKLKVIDLRLSQLDPADLQGYPIIGKGDTRMSFAPPAVIPLADFDKVPKNFSGWLLFLDEMNAAPQSVQAAAYKLVLDRQVGEHTLHSKVFIVCAGNKETDGAITNRLSTAMQSRMVHINLLVDVDNWVEWGTKNSIDHRIISFIKFRPDLLHSFDPRHSDSTFATPRTWEFASKLIKGESDINGMFVAMLAGAVGQGPSVEFRTFCEIYEDLPTLKQMLTDPESVVVPQEPSKQYAVSTLISYNITASNSKVLMIVLRKLLLEFQVKTVREIFFLHEELHNDPSITVWAQQNAEALHG